MRHALSAIVLSALLASPVSAKHCTHGKPCGNSCIAAGKTCGGKKHASGHTHSTAKASSTHHKRSKAARDSFQRSHPCPANGHKSGACPGYVVDHIKPLKRGGADAPSNMQWQTKDAAKAKDKWE